MGKRMCLKWNAMLFRIKYFTWNATQPFCSCNFFEFFHILFWDSGTSWIFVYSFPCPLNTDVISMENFFVKFPATALFANLWMSAFINNYTWINICVHACEHIWRISCERIKRRKGAALNKIHPKKYFYKIWKWMHVNIEETEGFQVLIGRSRECCWIGTFRLSLFCLFWLNTQRKNVDPTKYDFIFKRHFKVGKHTMMKYNDASVLLFGLVHFDSCMFRYKKNTRKMFIWSEFCFWLFLTIRLVFFFLKRLILIYWFARKETMPSHVFFLSYLRNDNGGEILALKFHHAKHLLYLIGIIATSDELMCRISNAIVQNFHF